MFCRKALLMAGMLCLGLAASDTVKFATGEWEPYTGQKMEGYGMVTEIVAAACSAAGIKAEYEFFPWKRAEANVEGGQVFATFPYQQIKEREDKFYFSDVLYTSGMGILMHIGNAKTASFEYSKPEDLKTFRVGIVAGTDAVKFPLQKIGCVPSETQSGDQNMQKLALDRLDMVIDDKAVLFQSLKNVFGSDPAKMAQFRFTKVGFGEASNYRLMVSKTYPGSKELLEKFNAGLKKIKSGGEYKNILKKYGM
jgi:polar amino acid transport system substrate-binding protein